MAIRVLEAPERYPLSVKEVKQHLRILGEEENEYLLGLISVAAQEFEAQTDRSLITQRLLQTFDCFPTCETFFLLERATPLTTLHHIKYYNSEDVLTTLSTDVYGLAQYATPPRVYLKTNKSWPTDIHPTRPKAVQIELTAGYAKAELIPAEMRHAMKMVIGDLYNYREDSVAIPGLRDGMISVSWNSQQLMAQWRTFYYEHRSQQRRT